MKKKKVLSAAERRWKTPLALFGVGLMAAASGSAFAVIETDPGDLIALPEGTNLAILYAQHAQRDRLYANGNQVPGNFRLDTDIGLARYVHYTKVGNYLISPQVILPFGSVRLKDPAAIRQSASGIGDPIVGAALWLDQDAKAGRYWAVDAFVSVPVGNYDAAKGAVNIGENRWKSMFQMIYVTPLVGNLFGEINGEVAFYGKNDDLAGATLKQKNSYELQGHLRYQLSQTSHLGLSYYHYFGGRTEINGVDQNNKLNNNRFLVTYAQFVTPSVQLQGQVGRDIHVENGFKENLRVNFRLLKVF